MKEQLPINLLDQQPVSIFYYEAVFSDTSNNSCPSDFCIAYCNKAAELTAQTTREKLLGKSIKVLSNVNEHLSSILMKQLTHVYQSGEKVEEEYYNSLLDRHFHVIRNKVDDGVFTMIRDITEEIKLKQENESQTEFANKILNNSLNGWFYCDTIRDENGEPIDFRFVRINPAFTRIIGLSEQEVVGKTHLTVFPGARANGIHEINCRAVREKVVVKKIMHYKGDHLDAWYDIVVSPLGENGLLVTFADITEMKNKEIETAKLANTLVTVIDSVQVGIFTFKPVYEQDKIVDFRFTMVNPALSAYVAQEPETLIGSLGSEWFPGYLQNGVFDMYRDTFLTGEMQRKQFHYNVDGIDVYLDLQSTRLGDEVLVTFSDFTPLQLAQLELQKSIRELQRSNQNLEEFTRAASHDLKEPIRKIQLFGDRLKFNLKDQMNDSIRELFAKMENAATRMHTLIDDLLEYSHVSSTPHQKERIDLNEVIEQVTSDLEVMIDESDAVIEIDSLPELTGHRRQIQQLFLNLVHNSIKYRKPGINPHIYIHSRIIKGEDSEMEISPADEGINFHLIELSDNGIGFEPAESEKIFNVFTRLHNNKEYAGTGIGLAIATKVMENHGGYILGKGVKGQGATFSLLFPI